MKISVAVPSLGYSHFLRACLESIAVQTHTDFEVLIADGGSTDGSQAIIEEFVQADPRFRFVSAIDVGQADGINKALALATGEIHCYLNADDHYLCTDAFEAAVEAFRAYPAVDVASFAGWYTSPTGRPLRPVRLRYHPRDNFGWMKRRTAVLQPAAFWRRKVTERLPFDATMHFVFDSVFFYDASREFSWMEFSKPVAGNRQHPGNKSGFVIPPRIREIARFEAHKFGPHSPRVWYLRAIAAIVALLGELPLVGEPIRILIYWIVNSLAFLSFYRLPAI